jgi:glycosyltransferase involved in cell wall biosynthesis
LGLDVNTSYLLFFGFIRKYKGLQLLLESFADERLEALPLKLIIAGEFYEDRKPYDELISQLGLENRLVLATDFIPEWRSK